jgi:hypothetical protein
MTPNTVKKLLLLHSIILFFHEYVAGIEGGIRSSVSPAVVNNDDMLPIMLSLTTTRAVASRYSGVWDIQRKGSHRIQDPREDKVLLRMIVWEWDELQELEALATSGMVTMEFDNNVDQATRKLRDTQRMQWNDFSCYRSVEQIMTSMTELVERYPEFVNVASIGESWRKQSQQGGHDIRVMILSAPSDVTQKETMVVIGGHHSRELAPPETVLRWAEHLLENYSNDADIMWILNRTIIHLVPLANPDGREIVQKHMDWYYRKNAHPSGCDKGSKDGVDLNRNYPMWFNSDGSRSSDDPCSSTYSGNSALSEPESHAIYRYIQNLFPQATKRGPNAAVAESRWMEACPDDAPGILLEVHAPGGFVYFPWGHEDVVSPNHHSLLTMAAKLAHAGNYTLWGPGQDDFIYFVNGDATDAAYGMDCVASFGFELGTEFYESCEALENEIVPMMYQNLLYSAKTARAPYQLALGPDVLEITVESTDTDSILVHAKVSDDAFIVRHAKFPENARKRQAIASVDLFVDIHPDDDDSSNSYGHAMVPADGAFDRAFEVATYSLNTSSWEKGNQHVLYVRATDQGNHTGPVSAIYVLH